MSVRKEYLIYPQPYLPLSGKYLTAKSLFQAKKVGFKLRQEFDILVCITKRAKGHITVSFEDVCGYRYE